MRRIACLSIFSLLLALASEGFPAFSEPIVADVTPSSFCVAWYSGEDSDPSLKIFLDENGTEELSGAALTIQPTMDPDSTAGAAAATEGVVKVRAEGLSPDTLFRVEVKGREPIRARAGEPLLNSLERFGILVPAVCRAGACSACRVRLQSGRVFQPAYAGLRESDHQHGYIHACVSYPLEDLSVRL